LELLYQFDSLSPNAQGRRWQVAAFLGDTAEMRSALATDSILEVGPFYIVFYALDNPLDLRGTEEIYPRAHGASATAEEREAVEFIWRKYELMRGRPSRAAQVPDGPAPSRLVEAVLDGLFADGDSAAARVAAGKLEAHLGKPLAAGDEEQIAVRYAVGQYGIHAGRAELARRAIADLRAARADSGSAWQADMPRAAAILLDAQLAVARQGPAGDDLLRQLDSALADPVSVTWATYGNLIAARLHEERGEIPAALAALRRRLIGFAIFPCYATYLREEGRLATLAGDRPGAIRAYRHYLALRSEAEPALQPEVLRVRQELEALRRESTDR
jgi:hypothetical protein